MRHGVSRVQCTHAIVGEDMAKELEKFKSDYKKLDAGIKTYALKEASAYNQRVKNAWANCSQGEFNLADVMVDARKEGVTGTGLSDFVKNKKFKEALELLDQATSNLTDEIHKFQNFSLAAGDQSAACAKLVSAIEKDLKGRKDKSESKKEIEELKAEIEENIKDLNKSAKYATEQIVPGALNYAKNFQKTVQRILTQAPAAQERGKDGREIPMLFVDRNIKKNFTHAVGVNKQVIELVNGALEMAGDDMKGAAAELKKAAEFVKELKETNDTYAKAVKQYQTELDISKDKGKIEKMIEGIDKAYTGAERAVRGAVTTMKKAG